MDLAACNSDRAMDASNAPAPLPFPSQSLLPKESITQLPGRALHQAPKHCFMVSPSPCCFPSSLQSMLHQTLLKIHLSVSCAEAPTVLLNPAIPQLHDGQKCLGEKSLSLGQVWLPRDTFPRNFSQKRKNILSRKILGQQTFLAMFLLNRANKGLLFKIHFEYSSYSIFFYNQTKQWKCIQQQQNPK